VEQNFTEAIQWIRKAAEQGHALAQNNLGVIFMQGRGVPQDDAEAAKWLRKGAEQGYLVAQYTLGSLFLKKPDSESQVEAIQWLRMAAEQDYFLAQYDLGTVLVHRENADDAKEAFQWLNKSAEQGFMLAQLNLGNCYMNGVGVKQDTNAAIRLFQKFLEQDLSTNFQALATKILTKHGHFVGDTPEEILKLAEPSKMTAQYNLGACYLQQENYPEAIKWFRKAAEAGDADAKEVLNMLEE
jgi:TPR repeat protein